MRTINDQYGHVFGDKVLITVAHALKKEVRNTDILVRFGGEEFVIIFANTSCDNGSTFAERIRQQIKALRWEVGNDEVQLTLSIGLYCLSPDCLDLTIDQIIHFADTALYEAKSRGRDRVEIFGVCSPKNEGLT